MLYGAEIWAMTGRVEYILRCDRSMLNHKTGVRWPDRVWSGLKENLERLRQKRLECFENECRKIEGEF